MKILLEGPILTSSGYGEHTRLVLKSLLNLDNAQLDIYVNPLRWGNTSWSYTDIHFRNLITNLSKKQAQYIQSTKNKPQYDIQIHVGIPNEFEKKAPYSVCVTAGIETNKVSPVWIAKTYQGLDKIIVPSEHSKKGFVETLVDAQNESGQAVKASVNCPVEVVPYPVKKHPSVNLQLDLEANFNFLCVAMLGPRKNLLNTIKWFVEVFRDNENVGLVLKTCQAKNCIMDRINTLEKIKEFLSSLGERKCKIQLLHGNLTEEEMSGLYCHDKIKALVSISHGEGYGLPIFEAAYSGLPIIATDWSGHLDFLSAEYKEKGKIRNKKLFGRVDYSLQTVPDEAVWDNIIVKDSMWAFPKEQSYKNLLKKFYNNIGMYQKWSNTLKKSLVETHNDSIVHEKMCSAIFGEENLSLLKPFDKDKIPKISLITSVFKAEEYIEQLMEDVTNQSIFDKCEWVILNANKPGDDFEEEVILSYKEKYPDNIVYERMQEDPGIYDTWNKGIKMSTGEFITNVNCDDRRHPRGLEKQAALLCKNTNVDLVYNDSFITHEPNIMFKDVTPGTQKYNFEDFSLEAMLRSNLPHNNPMWRRTVHESHGYFNQYYKSAGDWDFWLRCAFGGSVFKKHPEVLGVYYFNPTGMSTNPEHDSWKKVHEREIFTNYMKLYQERQKKEKAS
jgi:glycosyltransferase involved in cell wall biosynthesis